MDLPHLFEKAEEEVEKEGAQSKVERSEIEEEWMDPWEWLAHNHGRAALENGGGGVGEIVFSDSYARDKEEFDDFIKWFEDLDM